MVNMHVYGPEPEPGSIRWSKWIAEKREYETARRKAEIFARASEAVITHLRADPTAFSALREDEAPTTGALLEALPLDERAGLERAQQLRKARQFREQLARQDACRRNDTRVVRRSRVVARKVRRARGNCEARPGARASAATSRGSDDGPGGESDAESPAGDTVARLASLVAKRYPWSITVEQFYEALKPHTDGLDRDQAGHLRVLVFMELSSEVQKTFHRDIGGWAGGAA
jgi:hypothetical protein